MAVIINEFEVVVETQETPAETTTPVAETQQESLMPQDIHDISRFKLERLMRIWAG